MQRREAVALLSLARPAWAAPQELRFAIGQSWGPPFVAVHPGGAVEGILPDLARALAEQAGMVPVLHPLPPMRVAAAMESGEVDLQCGMHPAWWGEAVDAARWSVPVLELRDLVVAAPDGPAHWDAFERAQRLKVGTVHGYLYPKLAADFANGRLRRDDAPSQLALLEKLSRSRSPVGVVNEFVLRHFNRGRPGAQPLRALGVLDAVAVQCLFGPRPRGGLALLQAAVRELVRSGRVAAILARHL